MSSSLLSEPSTVKLLPRDRNPFTANCPAEPTPGPTPGPATLPRVCGGGSTPGSSKASSSNVRAKVVEPRGNVETSSSLNEPLRRASTVMMLERMSVSSTDGTGPTGGAVGMVGGVVGGVGVVGAGVGAGAAVTGSSATGTGTTSPV